MRFPIPLIVDLPDDQLADWATFTGVARPGVRPSAKDASEAIRIQVPDAVRAYFEGLGVRADVSVKR